MTKKLNEKYIQFNQLRERVGLPRLGRRQFLKVLAASTAGLSMSLGHGCGTDDSSEETDNKDKSKDGDSGQSDAESPVTCPECSQVAIAKEDSINKAVRTAIDRAGGLGKIKGGDTVVIKPNLCGRFPYSTRSEVTQAVIQAVRSVNRSGEIIVADAAAFGIVTRTRAQEFGTVKACEDEGALFQPFDENPYVGFQDQEWKFIPEEKQVPELLNPADPQYDHFINVPMLKNHEANAGNVEFTNCLKNFVGLLPFSGAGGRYTPAPLGIHTVNLGENVAELGRIVPKILMNVVDAITPALQYGPGGESNGFPPMVTVDAGLIIASPDRVACDSVSVAVLKHYAIQEDIDRPYVYKTPAEQAQITRATELGLGISDPELIELISCNEEIEDLVEKFRTQLT